VWHLGAYALGTAAAALTGWAGWRWYSTGEPPELADLVPFRPRSGDGVIEAWSTERGIDPALVRAVVQVESAGRVQVDGRPVIRLEVHHLERLATSRQRRRLARVLARDSESGKPWTKHRVDLGDGWQPLHHQRGESLATSQAREWAALALARQILGDRAIRATSIGMGQILGRHYARLGYDSPAAMLADAERGEAAQTAQILAFIDADPAMVDALRAGDLRAFAAVYNGPGQADRYATKIARAAGVGIDSQGRIA